jgi:hypothetical protein
MSWALPAAMLLGPGCASHERDQETHKPGSGIAEYRALAVTAHNAVRSARTALATVASQSNGCPPEVLSKFSDEVQRLQVESVQVRARSQAMQARGDAYFKDWQANLARVKDADVRALAEKNRPELEERFNHIKQLSQEGREAFGPFIGALRQLRNALEKDPNSLSTEPAQSALATARKRGEHVERYLDGIERELDAMQALITPPGKRADKDTHEKDHS